MVIFYIGGNMKFLFSLVIILCALPSFACNGGKLMTGYNGVTFCASNMRMNWWSAYQWCESQGYTLAHPDRACIYTQNGVTNHWQDTLKNGGGGCQNFGSYWKDFYSELGGTWLNFPQDNKMLAITYGGAVAYLRGSEQTNNFRALCDMGN
jgi:hypothetical protein